MSNNNVSKTVPQWTPFSLIGRDDSTQDLLSIIERERKKLYQNLCNINKADRERKDLYKKKNG